MLVPHIKKKTTMWVSNGSRRGLAVQWSGAQQWWVQNKLRDVRDGAGETITRVMNHRKRGKSSDRWTCRGHIGNSGKLQRSWEITLLPTIHLVEMKSVDGRNTRYGQIKGSIRGELLYQIDGIIHYSIGNL